MVLAVTSRGLWKTRGLSDFFEEPLEFKPRGPVKAVIGWGQKPSAIRARQWADEKGVPFICVEDGFVRSIGLGVHGCAPLSLVVDDIGIYYDAFRPSRLELLIAHAPSLPSEAARAGLDCLRKYGISKYNHAPNVSLRKSDRYPRILIIDQTAGDISVTAGGCGQEDFLRMVAAAISDYPDGDIWIKVHPDVVAGKKVGYLRRRDVPATINWLTEDCDTVSLLAQFDHVYVVTSQMGFEALILNKRVTVFGLPWYAGWGLTDDRHPRIGELKERRPAPRSLEQLFEAAYLQYARYIKPTTREIGSLFDVVKWLSNNKRINDHSRGTLYCVGMSLWKQTVVRPFVETPSNRVRFVRKMTERTLDSMPGDASIVLWGSRNSDLAMAAEKRGIPVLRMEDGFVRSAGLGSDLFGPLSLVVDRQGIYYDPSSRSSLERMLQNVELDEERRTRAVQLREMLVQKRISKYNVGEPFHKDRRSAGRRVILVPGQVEDDASIRAGSPLICRDADLLSLVRENAPDAWIIYKPHPDVVAGNRHGGVGKQVATKLADEIVLRASISDCIIAADEVHTMTSLAGFEALLFGKTVHCYGGPFYAGWGLTVDHMSLPHRGKRLSLEELVFVALCEYPRYRLPGGEGFCEVEDVVEHLEKSRARLGNVFGSSWISKQWRKALRFSRVLTASQ